MVLKVLYNIVGTKFTKAMLIIIKLMIRFNQTPKYKATDLVCYVFFCF